AGLLIALLDALGQLHFFLGRQQRHATDFLQVHPHRIVETDAGGQIQVNVLVGGTVDVDLLVDDVVIVVLALHVHAVRDDVDALAGQPIVNLVDLFRGELHVLQRVHDLPIRQRALPFPALHQLFNAFQVGQMRVAVGFRHVRSPLSTCCYRSPGKLLNLLYSTSNRAVIRRAAVRSDSFSAACRRSSSMASARRPRWRPSSRRASSHGTSGMDRSAQTARNSAAGAPSGRPSSHCAAGTPGGRCRNSATAPATASPDHAPGTSRAAKSSVRPASARTCLKITCSAYDSKSPPARGPCGVCSCFVPGKPLLLWRISPRVCRDAPFLLERAW